MKELLKKHFDFKLVKITKWNEIFETKTHIFIFNRVTKEVKIRPK